MNHDDPLLELRARIRATPKNPQRIAELLDALGHEQRLTLTRALEPGDQRRLWQAVDGYRPLTLGELVPATTAPLQPVRHYGRNSMPVFKLFEKRFYRGPDADPRTPSELYGANFSPVGPLVGDGYYVVAPHPERPELCIDYRRLPAVAPSDWPAIRSNERGLSRFVYGFMVDTLRGVSKHVTIGSAARHGRDLNAFFVLCREA